LSGQNYFCVHGHFYQPPREDPLTGEVLDEPGAKPYRNWNERIHAECYKPNASLKNFEKISFNLGPTLLSWMARHDFPTYKAILAQDRLNVERNGCGNAMAQAYNHTILPLASGRDQLTQVRWGIADFRHRFHRQPRGMWLPETAVDTPTLEALADNGIEFTILAPWQAKGSALDTTHPYRVDLPSGRSLVVFFYHQGLSTCISFDPVSTSNADSFIKEHVRPLFEQQDHRAHPRLVLAASDGELYGHHQKFRDQFLAHLMNGGLAERQLDWIYPELWLERYPVKNKVKILERTSWSCHHGIKRWQQGCDCTPGAGWKSPLRNALDSLAEIIDGYYAEAISKYSLDPWILRDEYIRVMLGEINLEQATMQAGNTSRRSYPEGTLWRIEMLLAGQYQRQRMFTSCGWFFDDFDRIEPRNNVAYAAQACWLTSLACQVNFNQAACELLKPVHSSRTGLSAERVFAYHLRRAQAYWPG